MSSRKKLDDSSIQAVKRRLLTSLSGEVKHLRKYEVKGLLRRLRDAENSLNRLEILQRKTLPNLSTAEKLVWKREFHQARMILLGMILCCHESIEIVTDGQTEPEDLG